MKTKLIITATLLFLSSKILFSQVAGQIALSKDFYEAMSAKFGNELLTKGLSCELWEVKYVNVEDLQNGAPVLITRIYLQSNMTSKVTLTPEVLSDKVNLKFTIPSIPSVGNYALVYYLNSYPEKYQTVMLDKKGDDGSGRANLKFQTNVSSKIGAGKVWGIYSLNKSSQNITINLYSNVNKLAFGLFGDIIDFIADAAKTLWNGFACVVVDALGTIGTQIYGFFQSLFLDDGVVIPRYRYITDYEYKWANEKIFNGNLPAKNKIVITNLLGVGKRPFTWPLACDGMILMNLGKQGYENPLGAVPVQGKVFAPGEVFIHELTHVWQIHTSSDVKFTLTSIKDQIKNFWTNVYSFTCGNGSTWGSYNYEQQAMVVEQCFNKRNNNIENTCEEQLVEANVRKGVKFLDPACQKINLDIQAKQKQITDRITQMKVEKLEQLGESPVRNPDGTFKVGSQKGIANVQLSQTQIDNDPTIKSLRAELAVLQQKRTQLGC